MKKQILKVAVVLFTFAMLLPVGTFAADDEQRGQQQGGQQQGPPQEAYDACEGKSAGDTVTVNGPQGDMEATCQDMQGQLVAMPEGMGGAPQGMGGAPQS